jgi:hypothetical protein
MVEINCIPLSGRGKPIHAICEVGGYCDVTWGKTSFRFPYSFFNEILDIFFENHGWYPLGATFTQPWKGLGKFMIEHQKYFPPSPKYASAIAAIMVKLDLIEFRELLTSGHPIELRKR